MCPSLLILNGLAMQHELQWKTLRSFLPFTGPVDGEEAQANLINHYLLKSQFLLNEGTISQSSADLSVDEESALCYVGGL